MILSISIQMLYFTSVYFCSTSHANQINLKVYLESQHEKSGKNWQKTGAVLAFFKLSDQPPTLSYVYY